MVPDASRRAVHTIPVPPGWSAEQSWEHISRGERLPVEGLTEADVSWVSVLVEGVEIAGGRVVAGRLVEVLQ